MKPFAYLVPVHKRRRNESDSGVRDFCRNLWVFGGSKYLYIRAERLRIWSTRSRRLFMGGNYLWLVALLYGCNSIEHASEYFPLQKGLSWEYRIKTETPQGAKPATRYHVKNTGSAMIEGKPSHVRRSSNGTDYYLQARADGIYRIGKRIITQATPQLDQPERKVLPAKSSDRQSWHATTAAYALHRVHPYELMVHKQLHIEMSYAIVADKDSVTVPAGRFQNCLRVVGKGQISLYTDPKVGYQDVEITTTEWYAPGVGLVKLQRSEPLNSDVFKGGTVTMELLAFHKPLIH